MYQCQLAVSLFKGRPGGTASGRRALAKSDCSMTVTNALDKYSPPNGAVYQVQTVVHVITDGSLGVISQSCVASGIDWLNRDYRARGELLHPLCSLSCMQRDAFAPLTELPAARCILRAFVAHPQLRPPARSWVQERG